MPWRQNEDVQALSTSYIRDVKCLWNRGLAMRIKHNRDRYQVAEFIREDVQRSAGRTSGVQIPNMDA